jgi:hypothetical protein
MLKVAPYSPPRLDVVEITLVPAQVLGSARANDPVSAGIPVDRQVDVSVSSFLSLTHPNIAAGRSSQNWPGSIDSGHAFDLPVPDTFKSRSPARAFDALANMLDCFAVGATRDASERSPRAHSPCASDDQLLRAHVTVPSLTYAAQAGEIGADSDYRTFKTIEPTFDESLFPDKVPDANRVLKRSIFGLFR